MYSVLQVSNDLLPWLADDDYKSVPPVCLSRIIREDLKICRQRLTETVDIRYNECGIFFRHYAGCARISMKAAGNY